MWLSPATLCIPSMTVYRGFGIFGSVLMGQIVLAIPSFSKMRRMKTYCCSAGEMISPVLWNWSVSPRTKTSEPGCQPKHTTGFSALEPACWVSSPSESHSEDDESEWSLNLKGVSTSDEYIYIHNNSACMKTYSSHIICMYVWSWLFESLQNSVLWGNATPTCLMRSQEFSMWYHGRKHSLCTRAKCHIATTTWFYVMGLVWWCWMGEICPACTFLSPILHVPLTLTDAPPLVLPLSPYMHKYKLNIT